MGYDYASAASLFLSLSFLSERFSPVSIWYSRALIILFLFSQHLKSARY